MSFSRPAVIGSVALGIALLVAGYFLGRSTTGSPPAPLVGGPTAPREPGGEVPALAVENAKLKADIANLTGEVAALTEAKAKAAPPPAPANPAAGSPEARAKALADGQAFFAQYPEAQEILRNLGKAQARRNFAHLAALSGLSPAQVEDVENATVEFLLANSLLQGTSVTVGSGELPEAQAKALLGEQGYLQYMDYRRVLPLVGSVTNVAGLSAREPLSPEQATQLVKTMAAANAAYQSGGVADYPTTDWNRVYAEARSFLTPGQVSALQAQTQSPRLAPLVRQFVQNQQSGK